MDFIGLENTITECLKIDGVQRERFAGERKPSVSGDTHLVAILDQNVRAVAMDVTDDSAYREAYRAYASGRASDYRVLRVPANKLGDVRDTLSSNTKIDVRLQPPMQVLVVGREEPIPEILAEHQRILGSLETSPEGKRVIESLYAAEAGMCETKGSWGVLLGEYITGLQGKNSRYSAQTIQQMLQLEEATPEVIGRVVSDMTQYRSVF